MNDEIKYSIILPAYNEAENIAPMTERLVQVAHTLDGEVEIIWVNDGSTDETMARLDAVEKEFAAVSALHFSRNFGHMAALCAGLEAARATGAVITLDSDGQHPPEMIPEMVQKWRDGADIVQTVRETTSDLGFIKRFTSRGFYAIFNLMADTDIPDGAADFRLLDREVVDALNMLPERVRFVRGLVHWIGFTRVLLPYASRERLAGETKYSLMRMCGFALSGITSFSVRPLRLAFVLTLLVITLVFIYGGYVTISLLQGNELIPGWTSMMFVILSLSAAQLLVIGIASEYLARLYVEQKHRPIYLVRKRRVHR